MIIETTIFFIRWIFELRSTVLFRSWEIEAKTDISLLVDIKSVMGKGTRYGLVLPNKTFDQAASPLMLKEFAQRSEELGFDSLWTLDRLFHDTIYALDCFATLSYVGSVTNKVRLGTAGLLLPLWPPALLAKVVSSLDHLSNGRFVLGISFGGGSKLMDEYEACGVSIQGRVTRFVQALETLRRLWSEDSVTYEARGWRLRNATMLPKPTQKEGVPILIGSFQENSLKRTAKLGNGWIGGGLMGPEKFKLSLEKVQKYASAFGRDPEDLEIAKVTYFCIDSDTDKSQRELQSWLSRYYGTESSRFFGSLNASEVAVFGTAKECTEKLQKLVNAGVGTFILFPLRPELEQIEQLASDVIPALTK